MYNATNRFKFKPLTGAVLAAVLLVGLPAHAADKTRISATTDIKPVSVLSGKESQALSLAAGRILLHTDNARQAIANKDKALALKEINQGLTLVKVINNALPKYRVTTEIKAGDATYKAEDDVSRRYVTVFDEQFIENVVTPVVQAKKHAASHGLEPIEDFSQLNRSTMKLDVGLAGDALALAKAELGKGKNDNADAALTLLQTTGITFEFDEVELPLTEAADNLKQAELEISEGKSEDARATLKLASDDLKKYEGNVGESRAKEVRELNQKIDTLASSLGKGDGSKSTLEKAKKEIASYWEHVVKWFK